MSNPAFLWQPLAGGTDAFAAANGRNQYGAWTPAGASARTLTYDAMQNLTSDGVTTYGFDLENRLLTASRSDMNAAYVYDPLGRRVSKTVNAAQTATLYDGDGEIGDYESGAWVRRYVPGPGVDQPVAIREGAGWLWPRRDRLGNVIARTNASGLSGSAIKYDPYGESAEASAAAGGFLFTGRRYDAETGLYYIRARMYSPELGRFLQTDPVGYEDTTNLYAYVGNDPVNATDPSGMLDVYIGGADDDGGTLVVDKYVRDQVEKGEDGRTIAYFGEHQVDLATFYINEQIASGNKEPINIIGHSYGAASAVAVSKGVKGTVDNLVGVDPVGKPNLFVGSGAPSNVKNVVLVDNRGAGPSLVAYLAESVGKGIGGVPNAYDDTSTVIPNDYGHGIFGEALEHSDGVMPSAKEIVDDSYDQ